MKWVHLGPSLEILMGTKLLENSEVIYQKMEEFENLKICFPRYSRFHNSKEVDMNFEFSCSYFREI